MISSWNRAMAFAIAIATAVVCVLTTAPPASHAARCMAGWSLTVGSMTDRTREMLCIVIPVIGMADYRDEKVISRC